MFRLLSKILDSPSVGILQLDISIAFNTASPACVIRQRQQHAPELCQNEQPTSECGVHQRSPLLFALALHEAIQLLCQQLQTRAEAWAGFHLVDGNAYALLEAAEGFLGELRSRLPAVGPSEKAEFSTRDESIAGDLTRFLQAAGVTVQNSVAVGGR